MLGQVTFGWIDRCCKQETGLFDKELGGKPLILIGDPAQLPPVGDKPLYHDKPGIALTQKSCIFTQKKSKKCIFKILMLPGTQDAYLYLIILF